MFPYAVLSCMLLFILHHCMVWFVVIGTIGWLEVTVLLMGCLCHVCIVDGSQIMSLLVMEYLLLIPGRTSNRCPDGSLFFWFQMDLG